MKLTSLLVLIFTLSISASAATFNVNATIDAPDATPGNGICADGKNRCTLRAAIMETNALAGADTINIPSGTYTTTLAAANEDNNVGGDWDIRDNVTLNANGAILQAATSSTTATDRVIHVPVSNLLVVINGATIRYGRALGTNSMTARGGGIHSFSNLQLTSVNINNNTAAWGGGGVSHEAASVTVSSSSFSANKCVSTTNTCQGGGIESFILQSGTLTLTNTNFTGNTANSTVSNRRGNGGGVSVGGLGSFNVNITGGQFISNVGGGLASAGAGLYVIATSGQSNVDLDNIEFAFQDFHPAANAPRGLGIGIEATSGWVDGDWTRLDMHRNPLNTSDASDNATGGNVSLWSRGSGYIGISASNSLFYGGKAFRGGAVAMENSATPGSRIFFSATNSSFIRNTVNNFDPNSPNDGDGGAIWLKRDPTQDQESLEARFIFCTFSDNAALRGPAIFSDPSPQPAAPTVVLFNSVIGYHAGASKDIVGVFTSFIYNHFDEPAGTYPGPVFNDSFGPAGLVTAPGQDYMVPLTTSPVINTIPVGGMWGCSNYSIIDQLFNPRPFNGACDKGAIELQEFPQG